MTYFAAIYGAGLAGCAIANQLLDAGKTVLLIDPHAGPDHTPGAPAALVNPAMGRYAKLSWEAEACYNSVRARAEELMQFSGDRSIIAETGVLRPAINADLAHNFRGALDAHDWPEGWISWVAADEAAEKVPFLGEQYGGLLVHKGFTVYVERYLNVYRRLLLQKGAKLITETLPFERTASKSSQNVNTHRTAGASQIVTNTRTAYENTDGNTAGSYPGSQNVNTDKVPDYSQNVNIGKGRFRLGEFLAENIIISAGSGTLDFPEFAHVPLHRVKGQIAIFEADHDLDWDIAVSAMGYILRDGKRGIIAGSTYEHNQNNTQLTEQAYRQILHKLFTILPGLSGRIVKTGQHAGIRVTTPNKLPAIGSPSAHPGVHIYTALGSKGLLFSEYVAGVLSGHLLQGDALPPDLDVRRFE